MATWEFKSVREILDEVVPPEVVPIGHPIWDKNNPLPITTEVDMAIYKGIVAGALASVSAREVAHYLTEDIPDELMDWDFGYESEAGLSAEHNAELNSVVLTELTSAQQIAACYHRLIKPDEFSVIDFSTDSFSFNIQVSIFVLNGLAGYDASYLIITHIEADGGPPSDIFLVRT